MAIAINGSGTITGISVGGLPDGIVDADMLAANAVTAAKISDSQITEAKLATDPQQGLAKAWVNFNGTGTVAIRDSFNVSSITDVGTGKYQANFSTAMPNNDYAFSGSSAQADEDNNNPCFCFPLQHDSQYLTTSVRFKTGYTDSSQPNISDRSFISIAIFGD